MAMTTSPHLTRFFVLAVRHPLPLSPSAQGIALLIAYIPGEGG